MALRRIIESAFPVATVRSVALPSPRVGTEADILYNLSPTATMGAASQQPAQVDVFQLPEALGVTLSSFDPSSLPFFSTGSLLGDCASYCTIGFDPSTPDKRPLPLMAPRLSPRRMCLDAVVMLPGFEAKDLRRVVSANLMKHLPRLDSPDKYTREPSYVLQRRANDVRGYENYGIRILSDCIEIAIDCDPSAETSMETMATSETCRTMFVGFANPAWSPSAMNRTHNEAERAARRVCFGVSRETLRRALPLPIIEASRMLSSYSQSVCGGTGLDLSPMFWLNAAMITTSAKTSVADPVLSDAVSSAISSTKPPARSMWEQDRYNRRLAWQHLRDKKPVTSFGAPFHFELVSDTHANSLIAANIAQTVVKVMRGSSFSTLASILPVETFYHPAYRSAIRHVIGMMQQSPPNFLASVNSSR